LYPIQTILLKPKPKRPMRNFTLTKVACTRICVTAILILSLFSPTTAQVRMRANLMIVDANGATLMDGNMTNYAAGYSNDIDGYDIWKMSNFGENFGILRSAANLVIERRSLIAQTDTTYFRIWNVQQRNYRIQVITNNLHTFNLVAFMRDSYLNQDLPVNLNDTTNIDFTVNSQPGSKAQNRFTLIYRDVNAAGGALPVQFTSIQLQRKNNEVQVSWGVENEINMVKYVVEYASDAVHFTPVTEVASSNSALSKSYSAVDTRPATSEHFYRIRAVDVGGKVQYSAVARLSAGKALQGLNVYPNPVANKKCQLQLDVTQAGTYTVSITAMNGQRQEIGKLAVTAGQSLQTLSLPNNTAPGIYCLQLTAPNQSVLLKTIHVL
jgi:hypothetical protein